MSVVTDERIDPEKMLFEGVSVESQPVFTVSEMAKFFFARSNHWVRWLEATGKMAKVKTYKTGKMIRCAQCSGNRVVQDGVNSKGKPKFVRCPNCTEPVGTRRDERMGNRIYTLSDVEEVAHGLTQTGAIPGTQLRNTLRLLQIQGEMHELL